MGLIQVNIRVSNPASDEERTVEALVDTGSLYTTVPASILRDIGAEPIGPMNFELADGNVIETDVGVAFVALNGRKIATLVAFGPEGVEPLLGAMTLQQLELAVDMANERLVQGYKLRM